MDRLIAFMNFDKTVFNYFDTTYNEKNDKNSRSDSNDLEKNIVCGTLLRRFQQYVEDNIVELR